MTPRNQSNNNNWDGKERRCHSDDHDTIVAALQLLNSHVSNFNEHKLEDVRNFDKIMIKLEKQDGVLEVIKKYVYIGLGILIAINGVPTVINFIKSLHGG